MSKRGRRRSCRRRKSSTSSKQSVSPCIFNKQNKNNNINGEDVIEKGASDSLLKENMSESEDEEKCDNDLPKEKHFRQDDINSFQNQKNIYTKTSEDQEKGLKIVTSVSVSDIDKFVPKVMFQQTHQPLLESQNHSSSIPTNSLWISCTGAHLKLEIQETHQLDTSSTKTTVVLMNESGSGAEMVFKSECQRMWMPNKGSAEQTTQNETIPGENPTPCIPASPPPLFNIRPQEKRRSLLESFSENKFWDIPPPQEFADGEGSIRALSIQTEDRAETIPFFDQLSESEHYEPMFMRPSLSTNRSSFTKDFITCQKRKSWIRNNSIGTVEHRVCSMPMKRRQTYPGTFQCGLTMPEDFLLPYSDSFSSLFMYSLPLQTERLGRIPLDDDRLSAFGMSHIISSQTKRSCKSPLEVPDCWDGKQALLRPYYLTSSEDPEDTFSIYDNNQPDQASKQGRGSLDTDYCEGKVERNELADSGFDQEVGEIEYQTAGRSHRRLTIQITPPSCSGSEEKMLQSPPALIFQKNLEENQKDSVFMSPERRKSSVTTTTMGEGEQRSLHSSVTSSLGLMTKPHKAEQRISSPPSLNTEQTTKENQLVPEITESSSSFLQLISEESTHPQQHGIAGDDDPNPHMVTAKRFAFADVPEPLQEPDKPDTPIILSSCVENKDNLRLMASKDPDGCSNADRWAKRRNLFKESKQWNSAGGSSITSEITEESVSEEIHSVDLTVQDDEDRGFYTETFHSSAWIYQGDEIVSESIRPSLTRTRTVSIRDRTMKISKGSGEYPWGFRIQFSKPIVVTEVDTNGAAEEAGLIVGDYVLAVNGIDVTSIPHSEAADLARQGPDVLTLTIGSDISRVPNTPRPACRGYLHKRTQSGLIKGWRKRWFALRHDCCLYYYRHKRDEGRRRALSVVKLEGAEVGADTSLGKPFVMKLRPQSGSRVYFFCATSNQEMKRWMEAMEKAIHPITQNHVWMDVTRHNSNLPPLAVKNPDCLGLLHKMNKSRDMWVQHYCILKDGCLYLYSGIRATHAHGGIYLQGYMAREQPYGSRKSTIELKPLSDEFTTFHLCAENQAENKRWIVAIKASIKKWLPLHQALQDYMSLPPEETRM